MIETILGVKITHLGAGLAGGTVRYILLGGSWMQGATSIVAGSLTAGYLTTPAYFATIRYMPQVAEPSTEHAVGFIVGLTGLLICEGIMNYVKKRRDAYLQTDPAPLRPGPPVPAPAATPKAGE